MCGAELRSRESLVSEAWRVLGGVLDPEVPALSVCDLGLVRNITVGDDGLQVVLTPTYSGCPATEVIGQSVTDALVEAGLCPVSLRWQRAPAWTTDWISAQGLRKLRDYGIAPPGRCADNSVGRSVDGNTLTIHLHPRSLECPRCASQQTERLSAFGSTACKALYRCLACREPFEHFKPI